MSIEELTHVVQQHPVTAQVAVDPLNILQAVFDFVEGGFVQIEQFGPQITRWNGENRGGSNPLGWSSQGRPYF